MDASTILRHLDEERRRLARAGDVLDLLPHVTRLRSDDHSHHHVIHSSLSSANADAAISGEIEYHRKIGAAFEWKLYAHDTPADLLDRLRRHGFMIGACEAVMVFDLSERADWLDQTAEGNVVRIDRLDQVDIYRRVAEAVLGKDYSFTADELAQAIRHGSMDHRGYIAYAGNEPVSIGRLYTHPQSSFGGLYGGTTLQSHRGRGYYRALVSARARDAIAAGAKYLVVDAMPTSRPILERMGFCRVTDTWPCEWRSA